MSTIPTATISRLVTYLRILTDLDFSGVKKTSSDHLAEEAQVSAFQVRKVKQLPITRTFTNMIFPCVAFSILIPKKLETR